MQQTLGDDVYRDIQLVERWADRPFFRSAREGDYGPGQYSGRAYYLEHLTNFFVFGGGGTALVSGHRGVGKTATVDQALLNALDAIDQQNKDNIQKRRTILKTRVEDELRRAQVDRLRPKELIVLKLDFGQVALSKQRPPARGQRAKAADKAPSEAQAREPSRISEIDPRQVLIEIIKGLHHYFGERPHRLAADPVGAVRRRGDPQAGVRVLRTDG